MHRLTMFASLYTAAFAGMASAQIFMAGLDPDPFQGAVKEYSLDGMPVSSTVSASLPRYPGSIAVSGTQAYVSNASAGSVSTFNISSGAVTSFIFGLQNPGRIALFDNRLYILENSSRISVYAADTGALLQSTFLSVSARDFQIFDGKLYTLGNDLGIYDAATGSTINASFYSSLYFLKGTDPDGFAVSSSGIYLSYQYSGQIARIDATTGTLLDSTFISGTLSRPRDLVVFSGSLYVLNQGSATVGVYDASTGGVINSSLFNFVPVTGSYSRYNGETYHLAVIPEPSVAALLGAGALILGCGFIGGSRVFRSLA